MASSFFEEDDADPSNSFFENGETIDDDVELAGADPAKHKPTKEEYDNMLQEFSVMFRLDKRGKRQKIAIAVVLSLLLIGVVSFGVNLVVQGNKQAGLLRDSKTILAVFSLPYQTSVTVRVDNDDGSEPNSQNKPVERSTSLLANQLRRKVLKQTDTGPKKRKDGKMALTGGARKAKDFIQKKRGPTLSKKDLLAQQEAAKRALEAALKRNEMGGRTERIVGAPKLRAGQVAKSQLSALCSKNREKLVACSKKHAEGGEFMVALLINDTGRVGRADASVQGKRNAELSTCVLNKLSRVNYGVQKKATRFRCRVNK